MIFKGNARKGPIALALHLSNEIDNEAVHIHEIRGAASDNLYDAFREWALICDQSRATKPFYSLSINPDPTQRDWTPDEWQGAIQAVETRLGLTGQPRAVIFHEKIGDSDGELRSHCHVVWSRIDGETLKAIPTSHDRYRLKACARDLAKEFGLELRYGEAKQSAYDHGKAQGHNRDPETAETRQAIITAIWERTESPKDLAVAMNKAGYVLARGDRRAFIVVDRDGEIHALARQIKGIRTKQIRERLGDTTPFPDVEQARDEQRMRREAQEKIEAPTIRADLALQQRRLRKLIRQAERADHLEAEQRKRLRAEMTRAQSRHKAEYIFLRIQHRFEECRILRKRERQKPKGFLAWFCKATGIEAIIERKRTIQDQERESVKRAVLAELEKSQSQEEESLKRQYEIMMRYSTASKRLEEKLKLDLGIRARSRADPPEPRAARVSPFG